jgi:ribosomal-protein-alanine N-acetyltransferase
MLQIRSATPDDLLAIVALEKGAVGAAEWSLEQYHGILSSAARVVLIAEENSCPAGFLVAGCETHEWEIENIVVAEAVRNQGWGAQLVVQFLDLARSRGAEAVLLEVRETNGAARALYKKLGFVETGRRRKYYRHPEEDAILYRLRLP